MNPTAYRDAILAAIKRLADDFLTRHGGGGYYCAALSDARIAIEAIPPPAAGTAAPRPRAPSRRGWRGCETGRRRRGRRGERIVAESERGGLTGEFRRRIYRVQGAKRT